MPAPSVLLSGYTTAMYAQPGAAPTPLTVANLSSQAAVAALAIAANRINIEDVPNFGGSSSALKTSHLQATVRVIRFQCKSRLKLMRLPSPGIPQMPSLCYCGMTLHQA